MEDQNLEGKLKVGDKVIEITSGYMGTSYRRGTVRKITKTRIKVGFLRAKDDEYVQEYNISDGRSYPRRSDYHYTNISPITKELSEKYYQWTMRRRLTSQIYKFLDEIGHIPRELDKMTNDQLAEVSEALQSISKVVTKAKTQEKASDR